MSQPSATDTRATGVRALLSPASTSALLTDLVVLVARLALGVILLAHGWQKLNEYTVAGTASSFAQMGIPVPYAAATFATVVELVGGAALVLGLLTPLVALLNTVNLVGALVLVHAANGIFVTNGGFELVLALAAGLLVVAVLGGGKFSLDALVWRRSAGRTTAVAAPATT